MKGLGEKKFPKVTKIFSQKSFKKYFFLGGCVDGDFFFFERLNIFFVSCCVQKNTFRKVAKIFEIFFFFFLLKFLRRSFLVCRETFLKGKKNNKERPVQIYYESGHKVQDLV